ncbi:hypothetical protein [Streptomyces sp. H27-C3]|uniref:hypothetical protein n=1 Tax=Streptomyces sp. H27-C3 TaxID=3046305 RepID=UPI0024B8F34F|nr:hypothetical protein [Streptomyces sp. H27-C3]MDJ0460582.1 hypothetical protein [Streptomyces sp. H27-C3]
MSKQSGLGDALYVAGYDVSGDINALGNVGGGPAVLPFTAIDKSAMERKGGIRDGRTEFTSFFNPTLLTGAHARFSGLPTADQIVTYCRGTALGSAATGLVGKQIDYAGTRGDDGSFTFAVSALANGYGLEWGQLVTPGKRTDVTAASGTGVDFGTGPTLFGIQAYLHVFAFTGTSVTVKLQESSDNGVGDAWADVVGGGFTAAAGITSQRIQTARNLTVERYLRVTSTGTFTNAQFAVVVNRNDTETAF